MAEGGRYRWVAGQSQGTKEEHKMRNREWVMGESGYFHKGVVGKQQIIKERKEVNIGSPEQGWMCSLSGMRNMER